MAGSQSQKMPSMPCVQMLIWRWGSITTSLIPEADCCSPRHILWNSSKQQPVPRMVKVSASSLCILLIDWIVAWMYCHLLHYWFWWWYSSQSTNPAIQTATNTDSFLCIQFKSNSCESWEHFSFKEQMTVCSPKFSGKAQIKSYTSQNLRLKILTSDFELSGQLVSGISCQNLRLLL